MNLPLREHPHRRLLAAEVHARPYIRLHAPERASHLALHRGEEGAADERLLVGELCRAAGAPEPQGEADFHYADLGGYRLRWERHTEFSTYSFFAAGSASSGLFRAPVLERVPGHWLARLPGTLLVALHLELEAAEEVAEADPPATEPGRPLADPEEVRALLGVENFSGSLVAGGAAEVWMNFAVGADGFGRILVRDRGLRPRQAGRLVQRLFEIETYRMMALLALPEARRSGPELTRLGRHLTEITGDLAGSGGSDLGGEEERELLDRLTRLAAATESIAAATAYRFGAARAYHALVTRRIEELRERRIEGQQTVGEFMDRRFSPALRTCEAVAERLESLSRRVARAGQLLRARVDVQLEAQNRDLLRSMDRRARLQLALQETVEGLSVAAITYYAVGLVAYAAKAAKGLGLPVPVEVAPGLALPLVAGAVWFGLRRGRRLLAERAGPAL